MHMHVVTHENEVDVDSEWRKIKESMLHIHSMQTQNISRVHSTKQTYGIFIDRVA